MARQQVWRAKQTNGQQIEQSCMKSRDSANWSLWDSRESSACRSLNAHCTLGTKMTIAELRCSQVSMLPPAHSLVYLITSWAWFCWYDFNMPTCFYRPSLLWQTYRVTPFLLLAISYLSANALWVVLDRWHCLYAHWDAESSSILKLESKVACKMESLGGKTQPVNPLCCTIQ